MTENKIQTIIKILNEIDPINIAVYNSSGYEYKKEAEEVEKFINSKSPFSSKQLADSILRIFQKSFQTGVDIHGKPLEDKTFPIGSYETYKTIAYRIIEALK